MAVQASYVLGQSDLGKTAVEKGKMQLMQPAVFSNEIGCSGTTPIPIKQAVHIHEAETEESLAMVAHQSSSKAGKSQAPPLVLNSFDTTFVESQETVRKEEKPIYLAENIKKFSASAANAEPQHDEALFKQDEPVLEESLRFAKVAIPQTQLGLTMSDGNDLRKLGSKHLEKGIGDGPQKLDGAAKGIEYSEGCPISNSFPNDLPTSNSFEMLSIPGTDENTKDVAVNSTGIDSRNSVLVELQNVDFDCLKARLTGYISDRDANKDTKVKLTPAQRVQRKKKVFNL